MKYLFKIFILISIPIFFINSSCEQNFENSDYEIISNFLNVTEITGNINNIFIATSSGILKFDKYTNKLETLLSFRKWMYDIPFKNIYSDEFNPSYIYFTGRDFLYFYDIFTDTLLYCKILDFSGKSISNVGTTQESVFVKIDTLVFSSKKEISDKNSWSLSKDSQKIYWNIKKNIKDFPQLLPYSLDYEGKEYEFTSIYEDENFYYVGTAGIGFLKINKLTLKKEHFIYGTGSLDIRTISLDSTNNLWIAGLNCQRITRYNLTDRSFKYFDISNIVEIPDNQINVISSSKKYILFLTQLGGIFYYDISKKRFFNIPNNMNSLFFRCKPINDKTFLVSNDRGIGIVNVEDRKFQLIFDNIPSIIDLEFYRDTIYFVSQNKLYKTTLKDSLYYPVNFDFPVFIVYQYYKDDSVEILLDNAYVHIKTDDNLFRSYPNNLFGEFYDLYYKKGSILVAATDGFGIFPLKEKKWKIFNKKRYPLPSNSFYNILIYKDYLITTSRSSLVKINYEKLLSEY